VQAAEAADIHNGEEIKYREPKLMTAAPFSSLPFSAAAAGTPRRQPAHQAAAVSAPQIERASAAL